MGILMPLITRFDKGSSLHLTAIDSEYVKYRKVMAIKHGPNRVNIQLLFVASTLFKRNKIIPTKKNNDVVIKLI